MQTQILGLHERRKLRRLISGAMAGAILGAGLIAMPAHADNHQVTTLSDDGSVGSLRGAIEAANADPGSSEIHIRFDQDLPAGSFELNSALPTITNSNAAVEVTVRQGITLPQTLMIGGNGRLIIYDRNEDTDAPFVHGALNGNVNATGDANAAATVDMYDTAEIIGNATAGGSNGNQGIFTLTQNSSITGNVTANAGGSFNLVDDSFINGGVTINGGEVNLANSTSITSANNSKVLVNNGGSLNLNGDNGADGVGNNNTPDSGDGGVGTNGALGAYGIDPPAPPPAPVNTFSPSGPLYFPGPSITSDVEVRSGGSINLSAGTGGLGGDGYNGGVGGVGGNGALGNGTGGIGGTGGAGANGGVGIRAGDVSINGAVTTYDGQVYLQAGDGGNGGSGGNGGNGGTGGNGGAYNSFGGNGGTGGNGGVGGSGGNAGYGGNGGNASITGNVSANGRSGILLTAGDGGMGGNDGAQGTSGVAGTNGNYGASAGAGGAGGAGGTYGNGGAGGDSFIIGDVIANDSSFFGLIGGDADTGAGGGDAGKAYITGDVTTNDSSEISASRGSSITGTVTANDSSVIGVGGSIITGDVTANDNSQITVAFGSSITGDVIANNHSQIDVGFGSSITGDATANDNSMITVRFGSGITGDATFNDSSFLRTRGNNALNTDGGVTTTTFASGATFSPYTDLVQDGDIPFYSIGNPDTWNVLTVNNLTLNNSKLQPYWEWDNPGNVIPIGQTFDVLHYDGTLSGEFNSTVVSPFTFDINYTGGESENDVLLTLTGVDYTHVGGNQNQRSLESYLNHFYSIEGNGYSGADAINLDPNSELPFNLALLTSQLSQDGASDLNSYIHDEYSAHNTQTYWSQQAFINSITDNLRNDSNMSNGGGAAFALNQTSNAGAAGQIASLRQAMTSLPAGFGLGANVGGASNSVWAAYTGSRQHTDADNGIGSNAWSSSSDGYTVGYTNGGDRFSWGVAAGHQRSDLNSVSSTGKVEGYNAGLYAAWKSKSTYLNAVLGYGNYDNSVYDGNETDYKTHGLSAYLELGKRLKDDSKGGLSPYVSLLWSRIKNGSASDSVSGFNLESGSNNTYATALGLRYNHRMFDENDTLKGGWQAGLAWVHQFGDTTFPVNGNYTGAEPYNFQIKSTGLSGNAAQVQLGAYGRIHRSLIGFANYQGTFGSKQNINAVSAGVGYQF